MKVGNFMQNRLQYSEDLHYNKINYDGEVKISP